MPNPPDDFEQRRRDIERLGRELEIANRTIGIANNAFVEMLAAHDDAIQAAMKANQAALDLLKELS